MQDNALDDLIISEYFEKHRLDEWYVAASQAGRRAYDAAKQQSLRKKKGTDVIKVESDVEEVQGEDDDVEMQES